MMSRKTKLAAVLLLLLLVAVGCLEWWLQCGGVSHAELMDAVVSESRAVQARINARCDAIDAKLDRIEAKIDRLVELAAPKLPDGMRAVE